MASIDDTHKAVGDEKHDLQLVVLRAAFVMFIMTKLVPWMHYGHDLNSSNTLMTQPTPPPTPQESCACVKKVFIRSRDGPELEAFLKRAAELNPTIRSNSANHGPAPNDVIYGQEWHSLSVVQQKQYLFDAEDEWEGLDQVCCGFCR